MIAMKSRGLINQYVAGVSACVSLLASGSCYGWMTPIMKHLMSEDSELPVTADDLPLSASLIELGSVFTCIPSGVLINYLGRKPVLLATFPIYMIGWLLILYCRTALMLLVARTIHGLAMGVVFTVAPVYLGEIASDKVRGIITSLFFNCWWLGFIVAYAAGPYLSFYNFTYLMVLQNVVFALLFFWQPDTPYFHAMAENEKKAYGALRWFRSGDSDLLNKELESIKLSIEENKQSLGLKEVVATPVDRKALLILNILTIVRACTGNGAIVVFVTEIFDNTPNLSIAPSDATITYGIVMFIGGCIGSFTVDYLGRRPLVLVSCLGSFLCHVVLGTYYLLLSNTDVDVSPYSYLVPTFVYIYSGLSTAGMFPVTSAYTSELYSTSTRGVAASINAIVVAVASALAVLWFQPVTDSFGLYANFYIYAIISGLAFVYFYLYAPETKGKSFTQIRNELSGKAN